ncbi:hypothetical protein IFM12275_24390 [Nocardia sputorum]|nr:hypothetical protein IFM12275_24390 [Nocardia sputorum]
MSWILDRIEIQIVSTIGGPLQSGDALHGTERAVNPLGRFWFEGSGQSRSLGMAIRLLHRPLLDLIHRLPAQVHPWKPALAAHLRSRGEAPKTRFRIGSRSPTLTMAPDRL